jgi:hypothetical protein
MLEDGINPLPTDGMDMGMCPPPNGNERNGVDELHIDILKLGKAGSALVLKGGIPKEKGLLLEEQRLEVPIPLLGVTKGVVVPQ